MASTFAPAPPPANPLPTKPSSALSATCSPARASASWALSRTRTGALPTAPWAWIFALKPSDRWEITAYGAGTWTDGRAARATHLGVYWADDRFDLSLDHLDLDEHFDPQLGFVSRVGIRRTQGQVAWTPWVRRWGVRQASFSVEVEHIADPSHRTLERNVHFGNGIRLEREGWSWLTITRTTDVLDAPWSTNAGVVPEGIYRFTTWWLWLRTDEARRVSAALNWEVGGFYGGTLRSIALALNARPVPGLLLELDADRPPNPPAGLPCGRKYSPSAGAPPMPSRRTSSSALWLNATATTTW